MDAEKSERPLIENSNNSEVASVKSFNRHTNENSTIYVHSNDPKFINQGINTTYLRHYEGGYLPFISDVPYDKRKSQTISNVNYSNKIDHGTRPMHQTTFINESDKNYVPKVDYRTHNQKVMKIELFFISVSFTVFFALLVYQGMQLSFDLLTKSTAMNQLDHQFKYGVDDSFVQSTHYQNQFFKKNNHLLNDSKEQNHNNLLKNRKSHVNEVLHVNNNDTNYWSEYKRYHNYIGYLRGPGVSREYPERRSYNVLTGNTVAPSWSMKGNYKRVSGNVVLNSVRKEPQNILT